MLTQLKEKWQSLNNGAFSKGALRERFYNTAMVLNAAVTGYCVQGKVGATVSTGMLALFYIIERSENKNLKRALYTLGDTFSDDALKARVVEIKNEMGIQEDIQLIICGRDLGVYIGNPCIIVVPRKDMDHPDKLHELIKHELAHQIFGSQRLVNTAGRRAAYYNTFIGGLVSVLSLDPIPFLIGVMSVPTHLFLNSRRSQGIEYDCDERAIAQSDGKIFFEALQAELVDHSDVVLEAFAHKKMHARQIPAWFKLEIPAFVQRLRMKTEQIFDTHPKPSDRLARLESLIRKRDPDFHYEAPKGKTLEVNEALYGQQTQEERNRLIPYLTEYFKSIYGHEDFETRFIFNPRTWVPRVARLRSSFKDSVVVVPGQDQEVFTFLGQSHALNPAAVM